MQMTEKKELRRRLRQERRAVPNKNRIELSQRIAERFLRSDEYAKCDTVLVFISTGIEVDTSPIISRALEDGKIVVAPKCKNEQRLMEFYRFEKEDDLEKGMFDIFEPKQGCEKIEDFTHAVCIVPGLAFDVSGQRMGFGRGFYDTFLSGFSGVSCGVCFDEFILDKMPVEDTDVPVNAIFTQSKTILTNKKEQT